MKLQHSTKVQASPAEVWQFLQDTRAVVACMPGAELTDELQHDSYGGVLRVAIGPLRMNYNGQVDVRLRDESSRALEFAASGRDRRGGGSVRADVRVGVVDAGNGTSQLDAVTDLQLTGRLAALGRGVQDVSNTMFADFSRELAERVNGALAVPAGATNGSSVEAPAPLAAAVAEARATPTASSNEIKLSRLVVSVTRQRLADMFERWSEKLRP